MTNNENWVNKNSEVEAEEKENGAVGLIGDEEEKIVEDENTSDDVVEVVDETSEETEDEVADDATNDETAETEESKEDTEEEEISDENSEDENTDSEEETKEGMSRTEKIVLTIIAVVLMILLILFGLGVYNNMQKGSDDLYNLNNSQITSSQTDTGDENDDVNENNGANDGINDENDDAEDSDNTNKRPGKPSSSNTDNGGNDGDGSDKKGNSSTNSSTDDGKDNTDDGSDEGNDGGGNKDGKDNDNDGKDNDDGNGKDNVVPEYAGETKVRITKVNDETGIITVTVDGEKIVVPVQTTVFNGRVTKSGVAQGNLFGFNCGATVMLFYPQEDGMGNTEFSGYMNRTGDSLTILVDINGNNSKLLIKINGLKSL